MYLTCREETEHWGLLVNMDMLKLPKKLVSWRLNYNGRHAGEYTPLHYASRYGHVDTAHC
eukprot:m.212445 g.212445  ORF g.212445 m.212445 type:complete len:60 (+) comp39772_c0_seq59:1001-1180(+)